MVKTLILIILFNAVISIIHLAAHQPFTAKGKNDLTVNEQTFTELEHV